MSPAATPLFHPSPVSSLSTAMQRSGHVFLHIHAKSHVFLRVNFFFHGTNQEIKGSHTLPIKAPIGPFIHEYSLAHFSMHPRRRNKYKMSYKNPLAADPSGAHTMESRALEINIGGMQPALLECEDLLDSQEKTEPCMKCSPPEDRVPKPCIQHQPMNGGIPMPVHEATVRKAIVPHLETCKIHPRPHR